MNLDLLIFDFDGVISNSEHLSTLSLMETLSELGLNMTLDEVDERFTGMGSQQMVASLQKHEGLVVPDDFQARNWAIVQRLMREQLQPVPGAPEMLAALPVGLATCIASNSFKEWVDLALEVMELDRFFDARVRFNADMVPRGKPAPDLHRYVLEQMGGIDPKRALIIEDTTTGAGGGLAAGIEVWGCTTASPHPKATAQKLRDLGCTLILDQISELPTLLKARFS